MSELVFNAPTCSGCGCETRRGAGCQCQGHVNNQQFDDDDSDVLDIMTLNDLPGSEPSFDRMKSKVRPLESPQYDEQEIAVDDHGRDGIGRTVAAVEIDEDGQVIVRTAAGDGRVVGAITKTGGVHYPDDYFDRENQRRVAGQRMTTNGVCIGDDPLPIPATF